MSLNMIDDVVECNETARKKIDVTKGIQLKLNLYYDWPAGEGDY